eukprot:962520-Rhodomonas_salina.1
MPVVQIGSFANVKEVYSQNPDYIGNAAVDATPYADFLGNIFGDSELTRSLAGRQRCFERALCECWG